MKNRSVKRTATARVVAPLIAATVAALTLVPTAHASSNPITCQQGGAVKLCQKPGHASLHTSPTVRTPSGSLFGSAWLPGYGRGQLPPMIALD